MKRNERGVALLTVLLLVAVMSLIAVSLLDDIRFAIRRTRNAETTGQAQWYALGAETLAKSRIRQLTSATPGRTTLDGDWSGAAFSFPIEAGAIVARVADRGACFNLNSVVIGSAAETIADSGGIAQFATLLETLGTPGPEALRLAAALADWIDADTQPNLYGAEDDAYARLRPAYRTAGTLLSEVSELRAIQGFSPAVYDKLKPYVCALPQTGVSIVNINTLGVGGAPILSALYRGKLSLAAAQEAIGARPKGGWKDVAAFVAQPIMAEAATAGVEPPISQLALTTRYFGLDAEVDHAGAQVVETALLEVLPTGAIRTVSRRWTPEE